MDIIDILKTKLKNDLLEELIEYDIEDLESQIDDKITGDLFINDVKEKINDIRHFHLSQEPRQSSA